MKKDQAPPGLTPEDHEKFQKACSYMTRVDDMLACLNLRCRKRFDVPSQQSVVLLHDNLPQAGTFPPPAR